MIWRCCKQPRGRANVLGPAPRLRPPRLGRARAGVFLYPHRIFLMGLGLKELADGEKDIQSWTERAVLLMSSTEVLWKSYVNLCNP